MAAVLITLAILGIVILALGIFLLKKQWKGYNLYFIIRLGEGTLLTKRVRILGGYDYVREKQEAEMFRWMEKILKRYPDSGILYSENKTARIISLSSDPEMMFVISKIEKEL